MDRSQLPIYFSVPFPAVNGITTYSLYLARGLDDVPTNHEADEVIEIHRMPLADAIAMIPTEKLQDTKSVAALQATVLLLQTEGGSE